MRAFADVHEGAIEKAETFYPVSLLFQFSRFWRRNSFVFESRSICLKIFLTWTHRKGDVRE